MALTKEQTLEEAFLSLEEARLRKEHRDNVSVLKIPLKIAEVHGQFTFGGWVARSRVYTCALCEAQRSECLGVFTREDHVAGGARYTLARDWPQRENMRHEVERVEEPFCFACVQELGFSVMEDKGERAYTPQQKIVESGQLTGGTRRIIPKSVAETLSNFRAKPSTRQNLDVQDMLAELSAGDDE